MQHLSPSNITTKGGAKLRSIVKQMLKNRVLRKPALHLAFVLGFRGINRVARAHYKFVREYHGEKLRRKETLITGDDGIKRVYLKPQLAFDYNSRVNVGAELCAYLLSGDNFSSLTSPGIPKYIALSTSTLTPAATDTTLSGETTVAGLTRAAATAQGYVAPSALDGGASFNFYNAFTLTGAATTVVSTALFDAASGGNMFAEVNFSSSAAMATEDILQVTWTVNF